MYYLINRWPLSKNRLFMSLGLGVSCLGLWVAFSDRSVAQSVAPPSTTGANIDQIVLPPAADVPEEILRTEIIFEARSPLDGTSISPSEYAQLQTELAARQTTLTLNPDLHFIVILLRARRAFEPFIPF